MLRSCGLPRLELRLIVRWLVNTDQSLDTLAILLADHGEEKATSHGVGSWSGFVKRQLDAAHLQVGEFVGKPGAFRSCEKQSFTSVGLARSLCHEAFVDQLLEDAGEALFGDLEDMQKIRDPEAGVAVDEMQDAMVRAAKAILFEHLIGVVGEITIGEEEKFDAGDQPVSLFPLLLVCRCKPLRRLIAGSLHLTIQTYVSHVDLFAADC